MDASRNKLTPLDQLEPRRVCLIKPSALGDVVQTLPILAGLRARWPAAHITWVVNRGLAPLLAGQPELNAVIEFDRQALAERPWSAVPNLWRDLRRDAFDLTIDLQGLLRSGLVSWASRAPRRVGLATAREGSLLSYTDSVEMPSAVKAAVERYWLVARALGCRGEPQVVAPYIPAADRRWAAEQLAGLPRPWLAIHPGAQWVTKRWPATSFTELARRAIDRFGARVVLLGGREERALADEVSAGLPPGTIVNLAGETSLKQLAAVSAAVDVFLSGDTGPMHLAAACGTRVVAAFTCTSPSRAAPFGAGHRVVATQVACAGSYLKTCPTMHCMSELTPDRLWPALSATLAEVTSQPARRAG